MFYGMGPDEDYEPNEVKVVGAIGLDFHGANGIDYHPRGAVTKKTFRRDGTIYYCDGRSWPEGRATLVYS